MITAESSSFRDPSGQVYELDGRIVRTITERAVECREARIACEAAVSASGRRLFWYERD